MKITIGTAAELAQVNVETIRYYERRGLIEQPPRPEGLAYRHYPPETIARIRFIRKGQGLGFSLREIAELLSLEADRDADCGDVRARAWAKIEAVDRKIAELERMRAALQRLAADCPGHGAPLRSCAIMESLGSGDPLPDV